MLAALEAKRLDVVQREVSQQEIVDRCILPIVNEGARILEERIATHPFDLDVIYVTGYGFPAARGGPMADADGLGLGEVLARLRLLEERYGGDYWNPAALRGLVARGESFADLQ